MNKHIRYNRSPKGQARSRKYEDRRIRVRAGGIQFNVGTTPTAEDAQRLREMIQREAPGGRKHRA